MISSTRFSTATPLLRATHSQSTRQSTRPLHTPLASTSPRVDIVLQNPDNTSRTISTESGDLLRDAILANKVDLYDGLWAKSMNCNGGGQCGTCIVSVLKDDGGLCGAGRSEVEESKLKGKPASWRLACQTNVGDGKNAGMVEVRLKPKKV